MNIDISRPTKVFKTQWSRNISYCRRFGLLVQQWTGVYDRWGCKLTKMLHFSQTQEKHTDSIYSADHPLLLSHINKSDYMLITCIQLMMHAGIWNKNLQTKTDLTLKWILQHSPTDLNHLKSADTFISSWSFIYSSNAVLVRFRLKHTECA